MNTDSNIKNSSFWIIKAYPFAVFLIAMALNYSLGIEPFYLSIPSKEIFTLIACSAIGLVINHSWIMTVTELTRNRFKIYASPEEWVSSGLNRSEITEQGSFEIDRCLNTHRNTTENVVYYILLVFVFSFASPSQLAVWAWVLTFPLARIGYTYSYFTGRDNTRGIFMTLTLLSLYGMAGYLAASLILK